MRFKLFILWQAVFLGLMTLVVLPNLRPATGQAEVPVDQSQTASTDVLNPASIASTRPLKVWEGVSSWYGEDFDGQPTANGETYDMYAATAAHPTLPLGSVVRVVNLRNHRSQVVRINDRGPYVEGRELDVSYGVACKLGFEHRGLDRVRIELLEVPSRPANPDQN